MSRPGNMPALCGAQACAELYVKAETARQVAETTRRLAEEDARAEAHRHAAREQADEVQKAHERDEFTRLLTSAPAPKALGDGSDGTTDETALVKAGGTSALALAANLSDAVTEALRLRRRVADEAASRFDTVADRVRARQPEIDKETKQLNSQYALRPDEGTRQTLVKLDHERRKLDADFEAASTASAKARGEYERFLDIVCEHRVKILLDRAPMPTKACLRCGSEIAWGLNRDFCAADCQEQYRPYEGHWQDARCSACHRYFRAASIPLIDDTTYCSFKCVLLSREDPDDWPSETDRRWADVIYADGPPLTSGQRAARMRKNLSAAYRKASRGRFAALPVRVAAAPKISVTIGGRQPVRPEPGSGGPDQSQVSVSVSRETETRVHALNAGLSRGEQAVLDALKEQPATAVELWQQRGLPKATVYRALKSLEEKRLIARDQDNIYSRVSVSRETETETDGV